MQKLSEMISLKTMAKTVREAKLAEPVVGQETPLDAKVQVSGIGVMTRKNLQKTLVRYHTEAAKYIRSGNVKSAYAVIFGSGAFKSLLKTEVLHSGEEL